jgi:hypothetical protein
MVGEQLPRSAENPHYWKWVIIALHNALQGFMVLALRGTSNLNVLTKKSAEEWMAAYTRGDNRFPTPRLDSFLELYKKIQTDRMRMYVDSQPFKPSGTQTQSETC